MPESRPAGTVVSTLIKAPWIVTMDGARRVLENHCILIDKGRIVALLPQDQPQYSAQEIIDLPDQVLMPGLINAHC
ncbi:MAG TPA: TRZ/ATZ family hydrolase, partial [Candidatus Kapabacteria bacterium]|nr:TRZ/ATZ family hydrolase [Candidatus Kapabacteria bacterium]